MKPLTPQTGVSFVCPLVGIIRFSESADNFLLVFQTILNINENDKNTSHPFNEGSIFHVSSPVGGGV